MKSSKNELGHRSISAVFWGVGGTVTQILLQLGSQITLARLLGPEQFGLFAVGAIVISFSNFFADIGIAYGLIQKENVTNEDVRFVFTWQFLLGVFTAAVVAAFAGQIALFFGDSRSENIVMWLSLICFFNALAAPALSILKRNLDFKHIKISQVSSYILGYLCIGIPLAFNGYQVWALVIAWVTQSALMTIFLFLGVKHSIKPLIWHQESRNLSGYGLIVLTTNITNWMINNIDRVIVGKVFAAQQMGLYTTPYNILFNPTTSLISVIQPVFFSATARIADQPKKIEAAYRALIGSVCLFILPVFTTVSMVASTFVLALYGFEWRESATILRPLALVMPLFIIWGLSTPMLWVGGHTTREFKSQVPIALIWIIVAWFAAHVSLVAVAWATFILFFLRCFVIIRSVVNLLLYDLPALWRAARGGVLMSIIVALVVGIADMVFRKYSQLPLVWLTWDIFVAIIIMAFLLITTPAFRADEVNELLSRLFVRLPGKLGRSLQIITKERM